MRLLARAAGSCLLLLLLFVAPSAAVAIPPSSPPSRSEWLEQARSAAQRHPKPAPLDMSPTVFHRVSVIPMDRDTVLHDQIVFVERGRITSISGRPKGGGMKGARVIDGRGSYLAPALADLHVHLRYLRQAHETPAMLRLFVSNGVTTILNLLGLEEHLALRDSLARGLVVGPDLWTSGFYVNPPFVTTVAQMDSSIRAQRAAGYDFVKIHGDLPDSAYAPVMAVAREMGMPVVGHAQRRAGIDVALKERQSVAHLEEYLYAYFFRRATPIEADSVRPMVRDVSRRTALAGVPVGTTLAVFCGIAGQVRNLDSVLARPEVARVPPGILMEWKPGKNPYTPERFPNVEGMEHQCRLLQLLAKQMQEDGVLLVAGTDTPLPSVVPGYSMVDELERLVEAGLTPYEALRTATVNAAEFLGVPEEFGRVAVGLRADLMLLPGDPRRDVRTIRQRKGVMLRGLWMDEAALTALGDASPNLPLD